MFEPLVFALLVLAVGLGFGFGWAAGRKRASRSHRQTLWLRQSYFEGLNHLLNERPDAAIDTFVSALDVNSDTLETHLALGSLLRRRGEVDRAIRVHQNLLSRPSLTERQQHQAQLELGLDYMKSGLLDRAEALFKELIDSSDLAVRGTALERLVEIYRDEKEWERAIAMADLLCHRKLGRDQSYWRHLQAHFSCELAEQCERVTDWQQAHQWGRRALSHEKDNVRALLIIARVDFAQQQFDQAIRALRKMPSSSPLFVSEALPLLRLCHEKLGRQEAFRRMLEELYQHQPSEMLLQQVAEAHYQLDGEEAAHQFVMRELPEFPSLMPLGDIICAMDEQPACQLNYRSLAPILAKVLEQKGAYVCHQCGFTGQQLHWCCPGCKSWGSMQPQLMTAQTVPLV